MLARPAAAAEHLTGVVLMTPSAGTIVMHHAPFAGMPAMTMTFGVPQAPALHPGDRISAAVDRSREPWRLLHVRIAGSELPVARPPAAPFLQRGDRIPSIAFVDQTGRRFSLTSLTGSPYALTFVYTRCVDGTLCPLVSAKYRELQNQTRGPIGLVEISLDPAYDRPPVLERYAAGFGADGARWHLLTGDPRSVLDFAARFGILEHSAGPLTIVHSERLAIVGRDGRIAHFIDNAAWSPGDVARELERSASAR